MSQPDAESDDWHRAAGRCHVNTLRRELWYSIRVPVQKSARPRLYCPTAAIATCEQPHNMKLHVGFFLSSAFETRTCVFIVHHDTTQTVSIVLDFVASSFIQKKQHCLYRISRPTTGQRRSNTSVLHMWVELLKQHSICMCQSDNKKTNE